MTPERWQHIKSLLHSALERDPAERDAFLAAACTGDQALRQEVESLVSAHTQAGDFIESPAFELMADSLEDKADSLAGQSLGHYQVISLIGAGGMGEVYLAEDTRLGRKVAVKVLPAHFTRDHERVHRFQQEARAASALNHPNIITIHEIGDIDSCHFIVSEFIEGETLSERLETSQMKVYEALDVTVQVVSALCAAHQTGIVHRDIKPQNIMFRSDGIIKVLDFGLAKLTEQKNDNLEAATLINTKPGIVMGTAHYMSPEQARGQNIDARTDLFSLGAVLYQMVAGRPPFEGDTSSDIIVSILERHPPPLEHYLQDPPPELQRIVTKALRKNVEERYQTSKDMLVDLRSLKEELAFEAKLESSQSPDTPRRFAGATRGQATESDQSIRTREIASAQITSSAEYVVGEIKRHKIAVASVVAVAALIIAGLVYSAGIGRGRTIDSLAVLPFINASGDPNTEYLSDGIAESIIYSTSQLAELKVTPRSSVFRYKGKEMDPQTVGRELGVSAVLTGRVIQRGDDLSISAELIDVRDNRLLWGQQYTRKIEELLAIQDEISREISEKLRSRLSGETQKRLTKRYPENSEAYRLYLMGRYYWNKRTADGYQRGIDHFQQAIERDPNYALAYTGLADSYILLGRFGVVPPRESMAKARAAATKALEMDDELAEAHTSLSHIRKEYDWDFQGAEAELTRAIQLNPNYATAHFWYALFLAETSGRHDEALAKIERAQELEPLSLIMITDRGMILYLARRYDQAIEQCRKALEMDPNFFRAHLWLGRAYEQKGMYKEAVEEFQRARQLDDKPLALAALGHAFAASGRRGDAEKVLDELSQLSKRMYVDSYYVAAIHAALGETEQAFKSLEKAYDDRSSWLSRIKVDPLFDGLRSDPRFTHLVQRIGLP